jgi:PAS domain S-box-containing protein
VNSSTLDLATLPASGQQRRVVAIAVGVIAALALFAAPFSRTVVAGPVGLVALYGGATLMALAITVMILFGQFALSRKPSLLVLACVMLFSAIVCVPFELTVPASRYPPLPGVRSNLPGYLWMLWHTSVPVAFAAYVLVRWREGERRVTSDRALFAVAGAVIAAYAAIQFVFAFATTRPNLYLGNDAFAPPVYGSLGLSVLLSGVSLALLMKRAEKSVIDAWLCVPAAALMSEGLLNLLGGARFSIGWYFSRADVLAGMSFLVVALLGETNRLSRVYVQSERRLRGIVDGVADALVVVDARGAIASVNRAAADLFGFAVEDLAGTPISRIVPDFAAVADIADSAVTETTGRDARGTLFPLELAPGRDASREGETILIMRDITKRKAAEEAIRAAHDRAVEAADVKAQFLATMSHEIRTPINAVVGMSELLLQTPLNEEAREYAKTVRDSAESLLAIVNDILDFSKIEAGRMELDAAPFAPVVAVENATDILAATARKKGLSLSTYVAADVPRRVLGDADRLRQVLLNLIGNAVKFTAQGSVTVRAVVDSAEGERVVLRFSVTDTGPGIAQDVGERLFEPFRQADQSTRRRFGGTGLGLSISRRIVELMGGRIGFDSSPGRGSTFWFTVPFPRVVDEGSVDRGERLRGARILVVDEDLAARQVVDQYLLAWGAVASSTGTAAHAFELAKAAAARRNPFDAVIVDRSAGGDGIAFAARLSAEPDLAGIPLVLVNGVDERMTTQDARARGFSCILRKPLRQNGLHDALVAAISGPPVPVPKPAVDAMIEQRDELLILVAEDNPVNRKLALQQLKRLGYRGHAVGDGHEAIEAVATGAYALVLMDCQMPEVDGFEATREIRRAEAGRGAHIPIVAMTANALEGDREACLAAGMDAYLAKPVQLSALRAVLEEFTTKGVPVA